MSKDMLELCKWALQTAKKHGADDARVGTTRRRYVEIEYRDRKPESIKEATTQQFGVELHVNSRYSAQDTSDLRRPALENFIANAIANTKLLEEDPYRSLPDARYYRDRPTIDLQLIDPAYQRYTATQRHEMARAIEEAGLQEAGEKVISVTSTVYDHDYEETIMTSNGFQGESRATECWGVAEVTVQDEGDRRPAEYDVAGDRMRKNLPSPETVGKGAARRALNLLGGKKIPTQTMPVIIENRNVARLLSGFVSALYGANIQQKRSFLAEKKNQKMGSEHFTLIDDPLIPGGFGSRLYDGDGFAAKKRTILDAGVLQEFFVDWYYSRKLGWEPTTGGPSNLYIPPGGRTVKQLMQELGRGIYITGMLGGNSNSTTGDFSVGILGQLFENGEPSHPVAEMNIAGNHLQFWNNLAEAANDPWPYSSWQMPSLVFTNVMVSGA